MAERSKAKIRHISTLVRNLDALIIAHRAFFVEWQDARFPDTAHLWHPDRRSLPSPHNLEKGE